MAEQAPPIGTQSDDGAQAKNSGAASVQPNPAQQPDAHPVPPVHAHAHTSSGADVVPELTQYDVEPPHADWSQSPFVVQA